MKAEGNAKRTHRARTTHHESRTTHHALCGTNPISAWRVGFSTPGSFNQTNPPNAGDDQQNEPKSMSQNVSNCHLPRERNVGHAGASSGRAEDCEMGGASSN